MMIKTVLLVNMFAGQNQDITFFICLITKCS